MRTRNLPSQKVHCVLSAYNLNFLQRMRQLMHDLARHVYNGNRTEEELSNMTRGDILMAAKGLCFVCRIAAAPDSLAAMNDAYLRLTCPLTECITQLRRKLGAARVGVSCLEWHTPCALL